MTAGLNQLGAFQNKTSAQLAPALAQTLIQAAQVIIGPSNDSGTQARIIRVKSGPHRNAVLELSAGIGQIHLIQASTNLSA
jgi:hypothetical protein